MSSNDSPLPAPSGCPPSTEIGVEAGGHGRCGRRPEVARVKGVDVAGVERLQLEHRDVLARADVVRAVEAERAVGVCDLVVGQAAELRRRVLGAPSTESAIRPGAGSSSSSRRVGRGRATPRSAGSPPAEPHDVVEADDRGHEAGERSRKPDRRRTRASDRAVCEPDAFEADAERVSTCAAEPRKSTSIPFGATVTWSPSGAAAR